ncbi:MAG: phenylalanine--tRNA ligase subunit beta [Galactobacillus timonensis]|uniref:phenylalanine--tRNA ligase subunit beta n=1 Tax=Galactobacillus timonensis TaxID=2041840 RepID=UPI0023F05687|nr:phenylalanine--tRNA ligase subunit beta [Galactobacillus timonensis]MCI6068054.1 phenylalanine--tRNA ligase subunit beta [Galactobacillus timonensis]MDD7086754.1 phenylalanine--tRNA ligase subunit beta [Galactobacillus timonensis]MDY5223335.1 phenylalanine--tRNA ligase subunit beta [Lachnospiraceae bacterium]
MKLSYNWISKYVDLNGVTPEQLAERMTNAGLEVEGIERLADADGLVIGEVMECEDVEGTHLHKTQVRISDTQTLQIVCGAPNCRRGLKVIVATPGARLPGGVIEARPLHGIESNGMLCALFELGVDRKTLRQEQIDGIEELPADAPVGEKDVLKYLGLDDVILDVSLTPNRADCSAMWNMAVEIGAILHRNVTLPQCKGAAKEGSPSDFKVATKTDKCSWYLGKVINHVKVGPSPKWMADCLRAAGMNSINNLVDISNFVMLETGQPMHFYDLAKLPVHEITVADDRELTMTALDGAQFEIKKGDLLILNGDEPTGIAGVMGGEESMIDENTSGLFLEAAHFDHASIRHTSIRLNLITEAAARFTKEIDMTACQRAMDRAVQLLKEYGGADGIEETVEAGHCDYRPLVIKETLSHCNGLLGTSFTMDQMAETLKWLHFKPEVDGDTVTCHIPSWRIDMEGPADVDEEVIRLLGFDSLGYTLPQLTATVGQLSPAQRARRKVRSVAMAYGLNEIVTYTLVSKKYAKDTSNPLGEAIDLAMPMSEARTTIRTGLMNSVLECVQYNEAHGNTDNNFYEISTVHAKGRRDERLAIVLDGKVLNDPLHHLDRNGDFYSLKGILLDLLQGFGIAGARLDVKPNGKDTVHYHPYRSAELWLDHQFIGFFGEVHPTYAAQFDLKRVVYAEVSLEAIYNAKVGHVRYAALPKFPGVERDIAVVVDRKTTAEELLNSIRKEGKKMVASAEIFDIYEGANLPEGMKSVALHVVYQADHTLRDAEIDAVHSAIVERLKKDLGAQLRA